MRIIFMGTPDFAVPALEFIAKHHEVVMVITQEDKPRGRGKRMQPTVVKERAIELNLPVMTPHKVNEKESLEILKELHPDVIVVVAYGQIIGKQLLDLPPYGCINIHGSILPKYRGAAPIQRAIMAGEKIMGVAVMRMEEGLDTGPVALTKTTNAQNKTIGQLHDELAYLGAEGILEVLDALESDDVQWEPQNDALATYAHKISKEDGLLDFQKTAKEVYQQTLAMDPYPGAYTYLEGEIIKLFLPCLCEADDNHQPGKVLQMDDSGIKVACKSGAVVFSALQRQGKKRMAVKDYLRGNDFPMKTILGG